MALLDSIKGPDGQIKKPILISLIGAGGLLAYLFLKGSGSSTSTGQNSGLTPDLSGLADAIKGLAGSPGAGGSPVQPPPVPGSSGNGGGGGGGTGAVIHPIAKATAVYGGLAHPAEIKTAVKAAVSPVQKGNIPTIKVGKAIFKGSKSVDQRYLPKSPVRKMVPIPTIRVGKAVFKGSKSVAPKPKATAPRKTTYAGKTQTSAQ